MKRHLHLLIATFVIAAMSTYSALAQISQGGTPRSFQIEDKVSLSEVPLETLPFVDVDALRAEDELVDPLKDRPWRFGKVQQVSLNPFNSGVWDYLEDGSKIWRMEILSPGAVSLNITFDLYLLPEGAELFIYSTDRKDVIGAFTDFNNQADLMLATAFVFSDNVIVEYYQPKDVEFEGELSISEITHGYRTFVDYDKAFGGSGSCNVNVACTSAEPMADQIRSVAMLASSNGVSNGFCSGALINNTSSDGTPYFLSADHCYSAPGGVFYIFNWQSSTCSNPGSSPTYQSISGATQKARNSASDFWLVQLNTAPPENYNPYYSGWNRTMDNNISGTVWGIHHPAGDIKKISWSTGGLSTTTYLQEAVPGNGTHWRVTQWSDGTTTEGGSSGSPIYDPQKRIVGQLHGGYASCTSLTSDWYGKLGVSWTGGGTSASRLSDWLDPTSTGATTVDGYDPYAIVHTTDAQLLSITHPVASYNSLANITPTVVIKNRGSNNLTSATVSYTVDGGAAVNTPWTGNLATNATATVTFPNITLTAGNHVFEATVTVTGDQDETNNSLSVNYSVYPIDAELSSITYPLTNYMSLETITPTVVIKNKATTSITTATVSYTLNGGPAVNTTWNGNISLDQTATVTFPDITLTEGNHVFVATVTVAGDLNTSNNSLTRNFIVSDCGNPQSLPFTEDFTAGVLPNCWLNIANNGNGQVWQFGTHANGLTGTGNFAFLNSDAYGQGNSQNADLITPLFDFSGYMDVTLSFTHYFRSYSGSSGTLYYSINGGSTWTQVQQWTTTSANPASFNQTIAALTGEANVKFKWNYTGTWGYYWDIDNIQVTGTPAGTYANFTGNPTSIFLNETVTFTDASGGGDITSWSWNFGAGAVPATANTQGPHVVTYTTLGQKTVSLTVNGDITNTKTNYITVSPSPFMPPRNLTGEIVNDDDITLTWLTPEFNDGFESYTNFALSFGSWTQHDIDGGVSYGSNDYDFPNEAYTGSFIIFNPSQTTPVASAAAWQPKSGAKYAACFNALTASAPNNDWLVSPKVSVQPGDVLKFWAKSVTAQYGLERLKVGISTTGTATTDFTIISSGSYIEVPADAWTEYSFPLTAYVGQTIHFALNCVSNDAFVLMIDDITVSNSKGDVSFAMDFEGESSDINSVRQIPTGKSVVADFSENKSYSSYKVYRNGDEIATTNNLFYTDADLLSGTYVYTVKAAYINPNGLSPASNAVEIELNLIPQYTLTIDVTGNGSVNVNGVPYTAPVTVDEGTELELEAIPDEGWQFDEWTGDMTSSNATEEIEMLGDATVTAKFKLLPVDPEVTWPTATAITYGESLELSNLTGGSAEYDGEAVTGTFAFEDENIEPNAGIYPATVVFTPDDLELFNEVTGSVNVVVNKATAIVNFSNLTQTYNASGIEVGITTDPVGLDVVVTYDGSTDLPVNVGVYEVVATIVDDNYEGDNTDDLTIEEADLTITANNILKTQGDDYVFSGSEFTTLGLLGSDEVTSVTLTSAGADALAALGDYDIEPSDAVGSGLDNYNITYVNGTLTVTNLRELTLPNIVVINKIYDGTKTATVDTWGALDGIQGSDDVTLVTTSHVATFASKSVGNGKVVTITGLTLGGADAANYFINAQQTTANITVKTLTLSNFNASSKVYDGTTTASGVSFDDDRLTGDLLAFGYDAAFADKHVGVNKNVNITNIAISGGSDKNNYTLAADNGVANADISVRTLVLTNILASDKVYDGTTDATLTFDDNRVLGDEINLTYTANFESENAGTGIKVNYSNFAISTGADKDNYTLYPAGKVDLYTGQTTANIAPRNLTLSSFAASNRPYNGTVNAENPEFDDDRISGDEIEFDFTATFADKNVGNGKIVSFSGISLSGGASKDNYNLLTTTGSTTANITVATLTLSNFTANNKEYDGTTAVTGAAFTDSRFGSDILTFSFTAAFANKNVGSNKDVNFTGITISGGADASNYALGANTGTGFANITAKAVTVTGTFVAANKQYDGNTTAVITTNSLVISGVLGGEVATLNAAAEFADKNVGTGKVVNLSASSTLSGADAGNYSISLTGAPTSTANITSKGVTLAGTFTAEDKEYDGTVNATVATNSITITGAIEGDNLAVNPVAAFESIGVGIDKNVTLTNATALSGTDAANYWLSVTAAPTAKAAITAKALTIGGTFAVANRIYNGTTTASITSNLLTLAGIVGTENVILAPVAAFADKNIGVAKAVNLTDASSLSGVNASNYVLSLTGAPTAAANITAKGLTIGGSFTVLDKEYDGTATATIDENNLTLVGVITNEVVTLTSVTAEFENAEVGENKVVTITSASLDGADKGNYTLSLTGAPTTTATITEAPVETYTLTLVVNPTAAGSVTGAGEYEEGVDVTVTAVAAIGFKFVSWTDEDDEEVSTESTYQFEMPAADITLTANFETVPLYTVTFNITDNQENPVEGAIIVIDGIEDELETDEDGVATIELGDGTYTFTITASGFEAATGTFTIDGEDLNVEVELTTVGLDTDVLSNIEIYPNPFSSSITLNNSSKANRAVITNLIGQKVMNIQLSGSERVTINTERLTKGIYLIQIYSENGERVIRKMIKE